jgi:Uma2 family endonuclease
MARALIHEPDAAMTRDEFLAWVEQQPDGRYERIDGIVVAMSPERYVHGRRKRAAFNALQRGLVDAGLKTCEVMQEGFSIRVENSDFEPDTFVRCGPPLPDDALFAPDPIILVEVLSPDSGTRDRVTKLRAYFKLPTALHYLIVWPDERRIVRHSRGNGNEIVTDVFTSGAIQLTPPGIMISVEEIYGE